ncbi:MAG: hypothetical protein HY714_04620 [Candidatus Omnitrophica bacterium]|nr:hypothetical protein [Candidatus Omnitrophota bacterium]
MKYKFAFPLIFALLCGCASSSGGKQKDLEYNPQTGTYRKTYTTGELGGHFVKDLLGIGND